MARHCFGITSGFDLITVSNQSLPRVLRLCSKAYWDSGEGKLVKYKNRKSYTYTRHRERTGQKKNLTANVRTRGTT